MNQVNPMLRASRISEDPEVSRAKQNRFLASGSDAIHSIVQYRLFHGDKPTSSVVECHPMEANAWNRNAAAYYSYQATLGRTLLPLLEWKREKVETGKLFYIIRYKENGMEKSRQFYGLSKADANREFDKVMNASCRIIEIKLVEEAGG